MDSLLHSKPLYKTLIQPLTTAFLVVCCSMISLGQSIEWETDIEKASKAALDTKRLVWLHFEADWCVPCQRLDTFVFSSTGVIRAVDQNVVAVKIDVDQADQLVKKMGVHRVPHDIVMTPAGRVIMSRPSPKSTSGYRKFFSDLDRPLQQLNSGDRDAINFGIDQIQRIARGTAALKSESPAKGFAAEAPEHKMAAQTVEGQRLARGFESAKRAAEFRSKQATDMKQKAELFIASEERKNETPRFAENPFFPHRKDTPPKAFKKPLMLKRDIDSATKNTQSFQSLDGKSSVRTLADKRSSLKSNLFFGDAAKKRVVTNSGVEADDQQFLPPPPPNFNKTVSASVKPAKPELNANAFGGPETLSIPQDGRGLSLGNQSASVASKTRLPSAGVESAATNVNSIEKAGGKFSVELEDNSFDGRMFSLSDRPASNEETESTPAPAFIPSNANASKPAQIPAKPTALTFGQLNEQAAQTTTSPTTFQTPKVVHGFVTPNFTPKQTQPSQKTKDVAIEGQLVAKSKSATKSFAKANAKPEPRSKPELNSHFEKTIEGTITRPQYAIRPSPKSTNGWPQKQTPEPTVKPTKEKFSSSPQFSRALQILSEDDRMKNELEVARSMAENIAAPRHQAKVVLPQAKEQVHDSAESKIERGIDRAADFALKGKCPVTLMTESRWVDGQPDVGCVHRNRVYLFASVKHREVFQKNPDEFSPLLAGYDPVTYERTKKLVDGDEKHGVFMGKSPNMRVVLFENAENREIFQTTPGRFINLIRQAMTDTAPKATKLR